MGRCADLALSLMPFVLITALVTPPASARFVIEKGGITIKFPVSAASQYPDGMDMSLGNFGSPLYGGTLTGRLVYVSPDHGYETQCSPAKCGYACQPFNETSPPLQLDRSHQYIMLVDRGPTNDVTPACKFTEKVWNAQNAGAVAVIVVNYDDFHTTMDAPDEDDEDKNARYLRNITVPAAFVTKSTGDILKGLVKLGSEPAYIVMDWTDVLPRANKVEWQFWSGSNDMCGAKCDVQKEFIKEFVPAAKELEQGNWTRFTPHYMVSPCPPMYQGSAACSSQCVQDGKYCAPDPDGSILEGYSGAEVVQENVRQLCVFQLGNATGRPWVWCVPPLKYVDLNLRWEYVTKFAEECTMSALTYNRACAEKVFQEVGGTEWSSLDAFRACAEENEDALLKAEVLSQRGDAETGEVYILPTVRINAAQYRGRLGYSEVLKAICAGFTKGAEPQACLRVAEDDCRPESPGANFCKANTNGKTRCVNTFSGYECQCGNGFIEDINSSGQTVCLNINECATSRQEDLPANCTCERCACKDLYGTYECLTNLANECTAANDYGSCWRGDFKVDGVTKTFHACHDNIKEVKLAAKEGQASLPAMHTCMCPACFTEFVDSSGVMTCKPKCDLGSCDEATGICTATGASGTPIWGVALMIVAAAALLAAGAYVVYRWQIRQAMNKEIRSIMSQYMPLEDQHEVESHQPAGP